MGFLDRAELAKQAVILLVGDRRAGFDIIKAVMRFNLLAQGLGSLAVSLEFHL